MARELVESARSKREENPRYTPTMEEPKAIGIVLVDQALQRLQSKGRP